jgi:photosystem II stability/assembly factor-like uncharacterized protein
VQDGAAATGLYDLFFRDAHQGWALLAACGADNPKKLDIELDLLSTTDSGTIWSRTQVTTPTVRDYGNPDGVPIQGCSANYAFADSLHGWINVTVRGDTMNTFWSFLLVTSDGGRTWKQARNAPSLADANMLLVTPSEGWLLGNEELFVTHDGTKSWQKVSVATPQEVLPATSASYYLLPTFADNNHGLLEVSYSGGVGVKQAAVLFATADGGRTWKLDRMVTKKYDSRGYGMPIVVGSAWVWVKLLDHHPVLKTVGAGEKIDASADAATGVSRYSDAGQLSFVTPTQGWVIVDGALFSTTDGGATWADIAPSSHPDKIGLHVSP